MLKLVVSRLPTRVTREDLMRFAGFSFSTRRVVVVKEKAQAYERLAPPLLNRFEKQVLRFTTILPMHTANSLAVRVVLPCEMTS